MSTPIPRAGLTRISGSGALADFVMPSAKKVAYFEDFLGDAVDANANLAEGTDSITSDAAILAGGIGGVLRITTGDAGTGLAADMVNFNGGVLEWQASNGGLMARARVKLSSIAAGAYLFFGFTDVATLEAPIESAASANTLTSNASNAVGFMFDTRMTDDNFWLVGVKADVDATHQDSDVAPVADTYAELMVVVDNLGDATFFINGVQVGTVMEDAITAATDLCWVLAVGKTSVAASITCDVDYVNVAMNRV